MTSPPKLFTVLVTALFCLLLTPALSYAQTSPPFTGTVIDNANLRAGSGTSFDRTGSVQAGQTVEVVACNVTCSWYKLDNGSWIFAKLVQVQSTTPTSAESGATAPASTNKATAAEAANLRSGPGTSYARVGGVTAGQTLDVTGRSDAGDWYQLADGTWIAAFLVTTAGQESKVVDNPSAAQVVTIPTPSAAPPPAFFILDFTQLFGKSLLEAEVVLGAPALITEMGPGDLEAIPGGGEARDYDYQGVSLSAQYDRNGTLRGMSMGDSFAGDYDLAYYGIPMEDWRKVLKAVGLPATESPSTTYPRGYEWQDMDGYRIKMAADVDGTWWLLGTMPAD